MKVSGLDRVHCMSFCNFPASLAGGVYNNKHHFVVLLLLVVFNN